MSQNAILLQALHHTSELYVQDNTSNTCSPTRLQAISIGQQKQRNIPYDLRGGDSLTMTQVNIVPFAPPPHTDAEISCTSTCAGGKSPSISGRLGARSPESISYLQPAWPQKGPRQRSLHEACTCIIGGPEFREES